MEHTSKQRTLIAGLAKTASDRTKCAGLADYPNTAKFNASGLVDGPCGTLPRCSETYWLYTTWQGRVASPRPTHSVTRSFASSPFV